MTATETDLALVSSALQDAAGRVAEALSIAATPGDASDNAAGFPAVTGDIWVAELTDPNGPCGLLILHLAGVDQADQAAVSNAFGQAAVAMGASTGATGCAAPVKAETDPVASPNGEHQTTTLVALKVEDEVVATLAIILEQATPPAELPHLDPSAPKAHAGSRSINSLADVDMTVSVELGRTKLTVRDLLSLHNGAVVQLDRPISHPVDVFVNGTLIARGEVVVVDEDFGVRITELLTGEQ